MELDNDLREQPLSQQRFRVDENLEVRQQKFASTSHRSSQ